VSIDSYPDYALNEFECVWAEVYSLTWLLRATEAHVVVVEPLIRS